MARTDTEAKRVLTVSLPEEQASEIDQAARELDRSRAWIMKTAITQWMAQYHEVRLAEEALKDIENGQGRTHDDVKKTLLDTSATRSTAPNGLRRKVV